jgi:hypothetical protein
MATITLKQQEIHAGGLVLAFGAYNDSTGMQFVKVVGKTESYMLLFNALGEIMTISPNLHVPPTATPSPPPAVPPNPVPPNPVPPNPVPPNPVSSSS